MTTFLLIRHATNDMVGRGLAGRAPGVHLNARGRAEAERLARRLAAAPVDAVVSSPLERARETAAAISARHGLEMRIDDAFDEFDVGEWTGARFEDLEGDERWRRFNQFRAGTRAPSGELMLEAQARAVAGLVRMRDAEEGRLVVVVTHADVIRAALAYFAGTTLDAALRVDVAPASITTISVEPWDARIIAVNDTAAAAEHAGWRDGGTGPDLGSET